MAPVSVFHKVSAEVPEAEGEGALVLAGLAASVTMVAAAAVPEAVPEV